MSVEFQLDVLAPTKTTRQLRVSIPASAVSQRLGAAWRQISQRAIVKGFRPGKAPMALIKRQYGGSVQEDVAEKLIRETLMRAIEQSETTPVSEPELRPAGPVNESQSFEYTIAFEVYETLGSVVTEPLRIPRPPEPLSEEALQEKVEQLRKGFAERVPIEEGVVGPADVLKLVFKDGATGATSNEELGLPEEIVLGESRFSPALVEALTGMAIGETRRLSASLFAQNQAGLPESSDDALDCVLEAAWRLELAELDDAFALDAGYDSLDALRAATAKKETERLAKQYEEKVASAIWAQLIALNAFEVPHGPIHDIAERQARHFMKRMFNDERTALPHDIIQLFEPDAERTVREELLIAQLGKQLGVEVSEDEKIEKTREVLTSATEAQLRDWVAQDREAQNLMYRMVLRKKVLSWLIERAEVTDTIEVEADSAPAAAVTDDNVAKSDEAGQAQEPEGER
jgi:trigger factor